MCWHRHCWMCSYTYKKSLVDFFKKKKKEKEKLGLRHIVSRAPVVVTEEKKRKGLKNTPMAQETLSTSLGPFLCPSLYGAVPGVCSRPVPPSACKSGYLTGN